MAPQNPSQSHREPEATETTALLADEGIDSATFQDSRLNDDRPIPKVQIALLCVARLIDPIVFFSIFPFVNQMVGQEGNLPKTDVGFYSGLIESLFSLTQMAVSVGWGRAADRFGRKPVLTLSIAGIAITSSLFGLSKTIWQMILFRCLAGVFAGTLVTIRTMITEHTTKRTQATAFGWFAFSSNVGIFIGPLIGGVLAEPAKQYPGAFGNVRFFKEYPYALSTFVVGGLCVLIFLLTAFFVEETLPKGDGNSEGQGKRKIASIWEVVTAPDVPIVLFLYTHVMLLAYAYTAIFPVFYFTPVRMSGFGFSELQISIFTAAIGAAQAVWMLLVFPTLQRRFGTGFIVRASGIFYPFFIVIWPLLQLLRRQESHDAQIAFWVLSSIGLSIGSGVAMSFIAVQLALNDVAPSMETLGTLNAFALALISGVRAFCPVVFTTIFALGVRGPILNGYLVWLILFVLALAFTLATRFLPAKAEGKLPPQEQDT